MHAGIKVSKGIPFVVVDMLPFAPSRWYKQRQVNINQLDIWWAKILPTGTRDSERSFW